MQKEEKRIYFAISPHINYYHSFRGDSRGSDGFGLDLQIMRQILDMIENCEQQGLCHGVVRVSWDYSDLYWTMQLQQKYQPDVLDRVIQRCRAGKDEVILGTWGNCALPILDTEEFLQQTAWMMKNQQGYGVSQLFSNRIAPYIRTQETMLTAGMIELFNKVDIEGILNYYAVIPFDTTRPFLNPRLTWDQQFSPIKLKSTISDAHTLMIPMYGFGDILDHLSIKKWFQFIHKKQMQNKITGHALVVLNHDMDSYTWAGTRMPKSLSWMPNIGGILELVRAVDALPYVEFANLRAIIPKLEIHGSTTIRPDVADGCFNGYYNWAQKYDNTKYWTIGQHARWLKCAVENLSSTFPDLQRLQELEDLIRNTDDTKESYIWNKILFASTTHFGMSMPFNHPQRQQTALKYGINALKCMESAWNHLMTINRDQLWAHAKEQVYLLIVPLQNRGITDSEQKSLPDPLYFHSQIPNSMVKFFPQTLIDTNSEGNPHIHAVLPKSLIKREQGIRIPINEIKYDLSPRLDPELSASPQCLKNSALELTFNSNGKIISFHLHPHEDIEFAAPQFLESAVTFGSSRHLKTYSAPIDEIQVLENGTTGISASIVIISRFCINAQPQSQVLVRKVITLYAHCPYMNVNVSMKIPDISGTNTADQNVYSVSVKYNDQWQEIIPCEIRPGLIGKETVLRIWKHNFFGITSSFDLDMREVDPRNRDIDCLVCNISDGWMAVSNRTQGLLVGFNCLTAANFAFTPLKIKDEGFYDDASFIEGQQIRINPFGTYYGKMLHYWTNGTGHAQKLIPSYSSTFRSTAPTFSGKTLIFDLILAPYMGDAPNQNLQATANHFAFPPLMFVLDRTTNQILHNFTHIQQNMESLIREYNLADILPLSYIDWVDRVNKGIIPENKRRDDIHLSMKDMIMLLMDAIRSKF